MSFYYSMKQIFRSPVKNALFFLLIGGAAFLLALGGSLWEINREMLQEFEDIFITVGTVEQKREQTETTKRWDAGKGEYEYYTYKKYGEWIQDEALDSAGAAYILEARKRPYFGALTDVKVRGMANMNLMVAEVAPLETGVADSSFPVRVENVLAGEIKEGDIIYICDHYGDASGNYEPRRFEEGKRYIMGLHSVSTVHGPRVEHIDPAENVPEYQPSNSVASSQYTLDGEKVYDAVEEAEEYGEFDVVTEGFYETERGKRWLESAKSQDHQFHTIPVEAVGGTKLLLPFYRNEAQIYKGRDITEEEYKEGRPVCLIPDELALLLRKEVGDSVALPLYYADYLPRASYVQGYQTSLLNAEGKIYPVFHEQDYKIVGIYKKSAALGGGEHALASNEVIIPWNALPENVWKDNIVRAYPMVSSTTSFQIPNGSIEAFMAAWEKQGVNGLEIKFYDNGYTQLKAGIESRKLMAWIFLASGCVLTIMILIFFSNVLITGQQERIAIERVLGRTKRQCALSILSGLVLLAAAGSLAGSAAGFLATDKAVQAAEGTMEFDRAFSNTIIEQGEVQEADINAAEQYSAWEMAAGAGCAVLLAAVGISGAFMRQVLKKEPLQILGKLEE